MASLLFIVLPLPVLLLGIFGHWHYKWNYGPSDSIGSLCHQLARDFHWDHADAGGPDGSWRHRNLDGLTCFIHECRDLYASLDSSQHTVLEPLLGTPLREDVLKPMSLLPGYKAKRLQAFQDARAALLPQQKDNQTFRETLLAKVRSTIVDHINGTGAKEPLWSYQIEETIGMNLLDLGFTSPSKLEWLETIEPSQVLVAMQHGRVSHFDATTVLPKEIFNVTTEDLVRMQGSGVPIQVRSHPSYACQFRMSTQFSWVPYGEILFCPPSPTLDTYDSRATTGKLSLRRLKKFIDVDKLILQAFQLSESVDRSLGQLWFGETSGGVHWDESDNFIVCLSGSMVVHTWASNHTDALYGSKSIDYAGANFADINQYVVALRPGEGIVIPSRTYHSVLATEDRISFSTFLEPKWGHMNWTSAPGHFSHYESKERRVLRSLLVQTAGRVWDKRGIFMFQQKDIEVL